MEIQPILKAVEWAIVTVAREEWNRLSGDILDIDRHVYVARSVEKSLGSMRDLQKGDMPVYNEWDALFYSAWYQPKQINLAYSILRNMRVNWTINGQKWWDGDVFGMKGGKLSVIDFGCGSLAMQFAIAIAAADSVSRGRSISEIRIDSYDSSLAMIWLGQRIWDEFTKIMKHFYAGHPISDVLDIMRRRTHTDLTRLPKLMDTPYLLTAIHAVYGDTEKEVKNALETLISQYNPVGFLFTTQSAKEDVLDRASPLSNSQGHVQLPIDGANVKAQFNDDLETLTEWRRALRGNLLTQPGLLMNEGIDIRFVGNFLRNSVDWQYRDPAIHVYMRRDVDKFSIEEDDDLPW